MDLTSRAGTPRGTNQWRPNLFIHAVGNAVGAGPHHAENLFFYIKARKVGQVLNVTSSGRMLFAKMDDGDDRVLAGYDGQVQTKTVSIKDRGARELVYYFPEK